MTEIKLSWLRPDLQETYTDATGDVSFTPTARHLHDLAVVVAAQQRAHVEGHHTVHLAPTGPDWCWEVRFQPARATPWTVHVTVPDVTGVVEFVDLPRVDPKTLEPVEVDEPLWWAALHALARETSTSGNHATAYPVAAGTAVDLWEPPAQPAGPTLGLWDSEDIYEMWDDIAALAPGYVTRSSIGEGTDGLPIYAYTFTPPAYGNTILLTGMHGAEKVGMYTVAQLMRLLVTEWPHHPALAALRARTRIVVVPIASRHSVDNNNRTNANGVDLNRNWDYAWDDFTSSPGSTTYKGTAPFSEPETRAIRELTYQLQGQGGLIAALDIHDTGATVKPDGYHFYVGPPANELAGGGSWIRQLIDEIVIDQGVDNPNIQMARSSTPTAKNWFSAQGLWSATIEYEMRWGTESMDSTNMTAALRWIGNVIIRSATLGSVPAMKPQPFIKKFAFNSGSSQISIPVGTSSDIHQLSEFSFEFIPPCAGFIEFYGHISVSGAESDLVTVIPTAGQAGTQYTPDSPSTTYDALYAHHGGGYSPGLIIIPFSIAAPVIENPRSPARIGLYAYASNNPAVVYRYRGFLKFTPSESPERLEQWSATGRGGQGEGALQRIRGV